MTKLDFMDDDCDIEGFPLKNNVSKLESLREIIIKANPSILDLEFGCKIKVKFGGTWTITHRHTIGNVKECWGVANQRQGSLVNDDEIKTVLGRKIGIADVLYTLEKLNTNTRISTFGEVMFIQHYNETGYESHAYWNLLDDDLNTQSDETLTFLWELLCGK